MRKTTLEVKNALGVHARASTKLVRLASSFDCQIYIRHVGVTVDAKSLMALMLLAVPVGAKVVLISNGADEDRAMDLLTRLFQVGFFELDEEKDSELRKLLDQLEMKEAEERRKEIREWEHDLASRGLE